MGLITGSGSVTRFRVEGIFSESDLKELPERIPRYAFRPLEETSEVERSAGWVNILDMFDSAFNGMDYLKEPWLALSWRVDVRKVPKNAIIQHAREAEEKIKAAEALDYLPKKRRQEIREAIRINLLKRAIPRSNAYDMIWNLGTGAVIFGATGNRLCDEFTEFFLKCFGLPLKAVFPYTIASQVLEKDGMAMDLLEGLKYSVTGELK